MVVCSAKVDAYELSVGCRIREIREEDFVGEGVLELVGAVYVRGERRMVVAGRRDMIYGL